MPKLKLIRNVGYNGSFGMKPIDVFIAKVSGSSYYKKSNNHKLLL